MTLTTRLRSIFAAIALLAGASAQAQFISPANGSFTGVANGTNYTGSQITGWTVNTGTTVSIASGTATLGEGEAFAAILLPNTFTGISPNFAYNLSFTYSGNNARTGGTSFQTNTIGFWKIVSDTTPFSDLVSRGATTANAWSVDAASAALGTNTFGTLTETAPGTTATYTGTFKLNGTANYNQLYLVFEAYNNGSDTTTSSLSIDNVSAVPEPESYAMFLAGLGAIGFMSRRRRNQG